MPGRPRRFRITTARPPALRVVGSALFWALLGVGAVFFASPPARAHQSSVVYADIAAAGRDVEVTLQVANTDLYEALGLSQDRPATMPEAQAGATRLASYFLSRIEVKNHGHACPGQADAQSFLDKGGGFFFVQRLHYRCLRSLEDAELSYNLFFDLDPRHQGLCRVRKAGDDADGAVEHVFRAQSRTLQLGRQLGVLDNMRDYLELGVEHIFTGYDHLAFLFGLLIIAASLGRPQRGTPKKPTGRGDAERPESGGAHLRKGLGYVVRIVTAFTIAHSVTLCASALGLVTLPSRFVESFIAVSIGYVALENILAPEPRHRFLLTFTFGLVHGFGFASVLKEIGLPRAGLLWSLLSFNVGVELGQLAVVVLGFPVLYLLARHSAEPTRAADAGTVRRGAAYSPLEILLLAVLLGLCVVLFLRFGLPLPTVCAVAVGLPALLLFLVPRYGYDRCVRIGASGLLVLFSLLWLLERAIGRQLFGGILG
jgi:hypothetical protein